MTKSFYTGDTTKYNWEKYVGRHMEAHCIFEEIGKPLSESIKLLHFKEGIMKDAKLSQELAVARAMTEVNNSFDAFVNQLTESISNQCNRRNIERSQSGNVLVTILLVKFQVEVEVEVVVEAKEDVEMVEATVLMVAQ